MDGCDSSDESRLLLMAPNTPNTATIPPTTTAPLAAFDRWDHHDALAGRRLPLDGAGASAAASHVAVGALDSIGSGSSSISSGSGARGSWRDSTPSSMTAVVHFSPLYQRSSWRPEGSAYQPRWSGCGIWPGGTTGG